MQGFFSDLFPEKEREVAYVVCIEYRNTLRETSAIPFLVSLQKVKATHAATPTAAIITSAATVTPTDTGTEIK